MVDIGALMVDTGFSWLRMFAALILSILFSIIVGISAATNERMEKILLPLIDVLQTIPILAFFPVAIYLIVAIVPGTIGINLAVIVLIFTSMAWNITFGIYEAVKSIPTDFIDIAKLRGFSKWTMYKKIYIPASLPRIAYQTTISWSIGLFYLVTSEIFSTGNKNFSVSNGIGVDISNFAASGNTQAYIASIMVFIFFVVMTRILFLKPFSVYSERFSFRENEEERRKSRILEFYRNTYFRIKAALSPAIIFFSKSASTIKAVKKFIPRSNFKRILFFAKPEYNSAVMKMATYLTLILIGAGIMIAVYSGTASMIPEVMTALAASFARVWIIYIICAAIAVPLGIFLALSTKAFEPIMSLLQVLSAIPATILLPAAVAILFILPFGGEITAAFVIFLAMIWYILFSVISGMKTIPLQTLELRNMLRLSRWKSFKTIYLPAILPSFVTGSITAIGGAWNSLIVAEYFTVQSSTGSQVVLTQVGFGIGKLIDKATFSGNLSLMLVSVIAMVAMVLIINKLVWQNVYNKVISRYKFG
jgi:NitT/TauT family transport system permease protein